MNSRRTISSQPLPNRRFRRLVPAVAAATALAAGGGLAVPRPVRAARPPTARAGLAAQRLAVVSPVPTRDDTAAARVTAP